MLRFIEYVTEILINIMQMKAIDQREIPYQSRHFKVSQLDDSFVFHFCFLTCLVVSRTILHTDEEPSVFFLLRKCQFDISLTHPDTIKYRLIASWRTRRVRQKIRIFRLDFIICIDILFRLLD